MTAWTETSPADYDARLAVKGHKRAAEDQGALFYVSTPTRRRQAPKREELAGQGDLLGMVTSEEG